MIGTFPGEVIAKHDKLFEEGPHGSINDWLPKKFGYLPQNVIGCQIFLATPQKMWLGFQKPRHKSTKNLARYQSHEIWLGAKNQSY